MLIVKAIVNMAAVGMFIASAVSIALDCENLPLIFLAAGEILALVIAPSLPL